MPPKSGWPVSGGRCWEDRRSHLPIGRDSDFFACGGHSLLAVRLLSAIEQTFGRKLVMADLLAAPTLAAQALKLAAPSVETSASSEPSVVLLRGGRHAAISDASCGRRCVVLCFACAQVGCAGADLWCRGSGKDYRRRFDLSERSARYLAAIRAVQPQGPYRLAGWSFGGMVAYEMARMLLVAGEEVGYLGLIDSYAPAILAAIDGDTRDTTADMLRLFARDLAGQASFERPSDGHEFATVDDLCRIPELAQILKGVDGARLRDKFETFRTHVQMARTYRPEPCAAAVHVYLARTGHPNRSRGWGALARGGLSVREIPGDHYTILAGHSLDRLVLEMARDLCGGQKDAERPKSEQRRGGRSC